MCFVPAFLVCMNFHDTHFNIGDLPCKSQSCAKLGKFCANGVPEIDFVNVYLQIKFIYIHSIDVFDVK